VSDHPAIVTVYGAGATAMNLPFVVMQYVHGGSGLADRLASA
jgi:hypothetical protein